MQINLETIRQHAGEKLRRIDCHASSTGRIGAFKKFLKIETQRLHLRHRFGFSGSQIVAARSLIVDLLIQRVARAAVENRYGEASPAGQFAIVALGGYGRQELAPHSDIDLLFLHEGRPDAGEAARLTEEILYLLWDIGFTVGHSARSVSECVSMAKEDIVSRNSMIEARFIWGQTPVFEKLGERLSEEVFDKQKRQLLDELMVERTGRYQKFGDVVCVQEPNVKETAGGLRDLHVLLWAARVAYGKTAGPHLSQLVRARLINERDAKAICAAYDFLTRVRNELHFLTGRKTDQLSLDLQQQAARNQQYEDTPQQRASELFMRDYYLHSRRLHRLCEAHLQRAMVRPEKKRWFSRARTAPAVGGFVMNDGTLDLEPRPGSDDGAEPVLDGHRMMLAFGYAQATGASLSPALQEAIQVSLPAVNRAFRTSIDGTQAFIKMLRAKGRVSFGLRLMHDLDFLGKFLPEFGRVTCLVQHDLYHRYTVDEHTLRALQTLDELANSRGKGLERYRNLYQELSDPAILHLALLLHDLGKGLGGGHTEKGLKIAERVCTRLQLPPDAVSQVLFLIREHLKMAHLSQRRDLADEKVIQNFAAQMGTLDRLNMLTLLTYADLQGVGQGIWNEWKDSLLWELYTKARAILRPEEDKDRDTEPLRNRIARMLASEVDSGEVREHFRLLPDDYARYTPSQTIIEHVRLAHTLNSRLVKTSWRVNMQTRCTDLHLCGRNRRGLFAHVAGSLTAQGVNILSVHLNTRGDGMVLDSFKVRDMVGEAITDPARWEQIDNMIKRALSGEVDVFAAVTKRLRAQNSSRLQRRKLLAPVTTQINWDNHSSDKSTILEVRTGDRMGLVYTMTSTLSALNLDIVFAKVATEKHLALDIFYITNEAGGKLADSELSAVETAIRASLEESALEQQR
ncbi:MAG TPA: [protein-PII] uridylyltransferase [Blastocatellia bacterium]|nr:[protein-PII] uridylyltransferase [Blastocatellia bacterium]